MTDEQLKLHVAEVLANQIGMRKGCPPIRGCLALMPPEMAAIFSDDAQAAIEAYRSALPSTQADDEVREALEAVRGLLCCSRPDLDSTMRKLYGEDDRQRVLAKIDAALAKVKPSE